MSSPVLKLQELSSNSSSSALEVLNKALLISKKLKADEKLTWIDHELNGYSKYSDLPDYRKIKGSIVVFNSYSNTFETPSIIEDKEIMDTISIKPFFESIVNLETQIKNGDSRKFATFQFPTGINESLIKAHSEGFQSFLKIPLSSIECILVQVKQIVLKWCIELEANDILGSNSIFDAKEIKNASVTNYNITNFSGVIGNIEGSTIYLGDYTQIHNLLKKAGIKQNERNELENLVDDLKSNPKPETASKFNVWLRKNKSTLGEYSEFLRQWIETIIKITGA